uniref:Small ribosomal subunit protein uS15m n=1 Tax=Angiostrongylus cantonensis TaxID=6313 RepID=A0A0K0DD70_ANGCA
MISSRGLRTTVAVARGRTTFFNKHKKVTDPAKQDPDYFEKAARQLPLDENYIDALGKLYYDKVGSERDLELKAHDNLVNRVKFGLPDLDFNAPRYPYKGLDVLENAPESVKKIFSIGFGTRRDMTSEWKAQLIGKVNQHSLDNSSFEMKIAWMTALIRHWSMLVEDISKETPKKPTWLTHRIWLVINFRRKLLRLLREKDSDAFERVINELKISYHVQKQPEHVKTRKAWAEAQLRARVEEEKEKRLEELHQRYIIERKEKSEEMEERRKALKKEQQEVEQRLHGLLVLEGKVTDTVGQYHPSLIGNLSETVMHSALFYHPKPDMVKQCQ